MKTIQIHLAREAASVKIVKILIIRGFTPNAEVSLEYAAKKLLKHW
jgi:hypothetical protein